MTALADLITARDLLAAEIAIESASPRPNYSVDGQSVSWADWLTAMIANLKELNQLIDNLTGATEITTIGLG